MIGNDYSMPWGTHKGTPIGDVPFDYLLRLYKKMWLSGDILRWFERQLKIIEECEGAVGISTNGRKPRKYLIEDYKYCFPAKTKTPT